MGVTIQAALFAAAQMHDPGPMTRGIYVTPGERVEMLLTAAYTVNFLVFAALVGAGYTMRRRASRDADGEVWAFLAASICPLDYWGASQTFALHGRAQPVG